MSNIEKDLNPDVFIGVSLPLDYGGQGFFNKTRTTLQQTRSNIKNLLLTIKGERLGNPTFGSDLMTVIFEQDDGSMPDKIRSTIIDAVEFWLPYLVMNKVEVTNQLSGDDNNINRYNVSLVFSLVNQPDMLETITFTLDTTNL